MGSGRHLRRRGVTRVKPGEPVPSVQLPSTGGRLVDLATEAVNSHIIVFFYPGDREGLRYPELIGCTPQACSFRDRLDQLRELGAVVFGVSLQDTERQRQFVEREHLTFELLSDKDRRLVNALGVSLWISSAGEEFTVRTTVVVEKGGRVARVFEDVIVEAHLDAVIQTLRVLHGKGEVTVPEEPSQDQAP